MSNHDRQPKKACGQRFPETPCELGLPQFDGLSPYRIGRDVTAVVDYTHHG